MLLYILEIYSRYTADMTLAAIGQSIIQLARPNTILCPLQITLGVEVHHKTGSEFVVELLRSCFSN